VSWVISIQGDPFADSTRAPAQPAVPEQAAAALSPAETIHVPESAPSCVCLCVFLTDLAGHSTHVHQETTR